MGFFENIPEGKLVMDLGKPHVTVLPQFVFPDERVEEFKDEIRRMTGMRGFRPFHITPGEEELFTSLAGEKVNVRKVKERFDEVERYHYSAVQIVELCGGEMISPWIKDKFSAHITEWENPEETVITALSLIHHRQGFGEDVHNVLTVKLAW